jgi:hypothetical protein
MPCEEVVVFEIPRGAVHLRQRLLAERPAWIEARDGRTFLGARLGSDPGDLAALLRTVEAWVVERGFERVAFELGGRPYTLRAQSACWAPA